MSLTLRKRHSRRYAAVSPVPGGSGGVGVLFVQIGGQTSLPMRQVERQFRNDDVRAVLPARIEADRTEVVLVATTTALAIVTGDPGGPDAPWMTRWAAWDTVQITDGTDPWTETFIDEYLLLVYVGNVRFESHLSGEGGRKALGDFVAAVGPRALGAVTTPPVPEGSRRSE